MTTDTDLDIIEYCMTASEKELEPLFERAWNQSRQNFGGDFSINIPGMVSYETDHITEDDPFRFPSISITGSACSLGCEHCDSKMVETMIPAMTPDSLWEMFLKVVERGGSGCLVSGGSTLAGDVPLLRFIPTIKRAKEELGLTIVVHTGVVFDEVAEALGDAGIDGAMLDIMGSNDTIREIYHLDIVKEAFEHSMELLNKYDVPLMPHIVVGLHRGQLKGEAEAVRMIVRHNPERVMVVAFKPLIGTPMEDSPTSTPMEIARVILACRLSMPDTPVIMGCARPGEHKVETDQLAIRAGVNGMAYPSEEAHDFAIEQGLNISVSSGCCCLMDDCNNG